MAPDLPIAPYPTDSCTAAFGRAFAILVRCRATFMPLHACMLTFEPIAICQVVICSFERLCCPACSVCSCRRVALKMQNGLLVMQACVMLKVCPAAKLNAIYEQLTFTEFSMQRSGCTHMAERLQRVGPTRRYEWICTTQDSTGSWNRHCCHAAGGGSAHGWSRHARDHAGGGHCCQVPGHQGSVRLHSRHPSNCGRGDCDNADKDPQSPRQGQDRARRK